MINTVKYKDCPELFDDIQEFSVEETKDHRRGSSFYRSDVIQLSENSRQYYPEIKNFDDYIGFWKTNTVVWDDNHGWDETYSELNRVEKVEKVTYKYKLVK